MDGAKDMRGKWSFSGALEQALAPTGHAPAPIAPPQRTTQATLRKPETKGLKASR